MATDAPLSYRCPLCQQPLNSNPKGFDCSKGHHFDRARSGYLNLLPVQHKASKAPGDNPDMVKARQHFLGQGHYQPIADALLALGAQVAPRQLLDLGCGEGFYSHQLAQGLPRSQVYGLDISKAAIQQASKQYQGPQWLVASSKQLPFFDQQLDLISCVFAFYQVEELKRCLAAGGHFIWVHPGPRHLWQARAQLYDQVQIKDKGLPEDLQRAFLWQESMTVEYRLDLNAEDSLALLQMTPHYWRASRDKRLRMHGQGLSQVEISIELFLLQKPS